MGYLINRLKITSLQAQVEASRLHSQSLAIKFDTATTSAERAKIARQYDEALKKAHTMQLLLELLEREQRAAVDARELKGDAASSF